MKTRAPPLSPKDRAKDEASAPSGEAPMARFKRVAGAVMQVPYKEVKKLEKREKAKRQRKRKPPGSG